MAAATDQDIKDAIAQHLDWSETSIPSKDWKPPRIIVEHGETRVLRRPFKSGGHWNVRWAGTARLVNPRRIDGEIIFTADYEPAPIAA